MIAMYDMLCLSFKDRLVNRDAIAVIQGSPIRLLHPLVVYTVVVEVVLKRIHVVNLDVKHSDLLLKYSLVY